MNIFCKISFYVLIFTATSSIQPLSYTQATIRTTVCTLVFGGFGIALTLVPALSAENKIEIVQMGALSAFLPTLGYGLWNLYQTPHFSLKRAQKIIKKCQEHHLAQDLINNETSPIKLIEHMQDDIYGSNHAQPLIQAVHELSHLYVTSNKALELTEKAIHDNTATNGVFFNQCIACLKKIKQFKAKIDPIYRLIEGSEEHINEYRNSKKLQHEFKQRKQAKKRAMQNSI